MEKGKKEWWDKIKEEFEKTYTWNNSTYTTGEVPARLTETMKNSAEECECKEKDCPLCYDSDILAMKEPPQAGRDPFNKWTPPEEANYMWGKDVVDFEKGKEYTIESELPLECLPQYIVTHAQAYRVEKSLELLEREIAHLRKILKDPGP